jgi:hypothetical protein
MKEVSAEYTAQAAASDPVARRCQFLNTEGNIARRRRQRLEEEVAALKIRLGR